MSRLSAFSGLTTILLVTAGVFAGTAGHELLRWDDVETLVENPRIRSLAGENLAWMFTTTKLGPYQPLAWVTLALDRAAWGGRPAGYHATNVLLHSISAVLLAVLALRLLSLAVPGLKDRPRAAAVVAGATALLWSLHPLRVESVAWATERRDVLSGAFLLGAALAWLRYATGRGGRGAYLASVGLFAASLLSKATAMGFVVVLVLLDAWPLRRPWSSRLREKVPFLVLGLAAAVVAWLGQKGSGAVVGFDAVSLPGRVALAGYTAFFVVWKTLLPFGLRAHYARPVPFDPAAASLLVGLAVTVLATGAATLLRRRAPGAAVGWWAFLVLLAPVSGLSLTGSHLVADRYSYLAQIPLVLLATGASAAFALRVGGRDASTLAGAPLILVPLLGIATVPLVGTWRDGETLWGRVLDLEPTNWVAHEQMAYSLATRGQSGPAMEHLRLSLEGMAGRARALAFLGYLQIEADRPVDALESARAAVKAEPSRAAGWRVLGLALSATGDPDGADEAFLTGLALAPDDLEIRQDRAEFLFHRGRLPEAEEEMARVLASAPERVPARVLYGAIRAERGDAAGAEAAYREALERDPRSLLGWLWLGKLELSRNRPAPAEEAFRRALALSPRHVESLATLAGLRVREKDFAEAERLLRKLVAILPGDPWTRLNLGVTLRAAGKDDAARVELQAALRCAEVAGDAACAKKIRSMLGR